MYPINLSEDFPWGTSCWDNKPRAPWPLRCQTAVGGSGGLEAFLSLAVCWRDRGSFPATGGLVAEHRHCRFLAFGLGSSALIRAVRAAELCQALLKSVTSSSSFHPTLTPCPRFSFASQFRTGRGSVVKDVIQDYREFHEEDTTNKHVIYF